MNLLVEATQSSLKMAEQQVAISTRLVEALEQTRVENKRSNRLNSWLVASTLVATVAGVAISLVALLQ